MTSLDDLLSQPLAKIEDDQFSKNVLKRINNYYRWRSLVLKSVSFALVILFLVVSSPVILLSQLSKVSDLMLVTLSQVTQLDYQNLVSQLIHQPSLVIITIVSLTIIFTRTES